MKIPHANETLSAWMPKIEMPETASLHQDMKVDVCVIGAGIAGMTAAYLLMREGKKVCVLEDTVIGGGQTSRTTAHLCNVLDRRYFELEDLHGLDGARTAYFSHLGAIQKIEEIIHREGIDCDLEQLDGYLFSGPNENSEDLNRELDACVRVGFLQIQMIRRTPGLQTDTGPALRYQGQMQFHPLKYLKGLAIALLNDPVNPARIFTQTHVIDVSTPASGGDGPSTVTIKTKKGFTLTANSVVVATNTPINNLFAIHTKQAAYRSYVVAGRVKKGSVPKALYWDTADPFHYVRVQAESDLKDLVIIGGEDHKTGQLDQPDSCFEKLKIWAKEYFPMIEEFPYQWSGQVMETVDGLGYAGHNPMDSKNVYVITGDCGNGMSHGTLGAQIVSDQILGRKNSSATLFNPGRVTLRAVGTFFRENGNVAAQYGDWFKGEPMEALEKLPREEGMIIGKGLKKIAAYKTRDGEIQACSAVCPHLGGIVKWNSVERSWDCPCHGSRFEPNGKVIEGPAITGLAAIEDEDFNPAAWNKRHPDSASAKEKRAESSAKAPL